MEVVDDSWLIENIHTLLDSIANYQGRGGGPLGTLGPIPWTRPDPSGPACTSLGGGGLPR